MKTPGNYNNVSSGGKVGAKRPFFPLCAGDSAGDNYFFIKNVDKMKKGINVSY